MNKLTQNEFYCVATREKVRVKSDDICVISLKNGNPALYAICPKTNTEMYKFIKHKDKERLTKKFGSC
jgi:hypothetical protein